MSPRPPRLSREQIVTAAFDLVNEESPASFSMRKLATKLGADPMSLYYHVGNQAELLDAVADQLWSRVPLPEAGLDWREATRRLAYALRSVLLAHPNLVPLIGTRAAVTPYLLGRLDTVTGVLVADGMDAAEALMLLDCVVAFVVGKVAAELRQAVGGQDKDSHTEAAALADRLPHLAAAMRAGYGWDPDGEFARGIDALLRGWHSE